MDQLKVFSHRQLWQIWQKAKRGDALESGDTAVANAMREHPEYFDVWEHLDELSDEQILRNGVHPILHIQMHVVIENQLAQNNPAEVGQILAKLLRKNHSRHEAIHLIVGVMVEEIADMFKKNRLFDEARYLHYLRRLN